MAAMATRAAGGDREGAGAGRAHQSLHPMPVTHRPCRQGCPRRHLQRVGAWNAGRGERLLNRLACFLRQGGDQYLPAGEVPMGVRRAAPVAPAMLSGFTPETGQGPDGLRNA